MVDPLLVTCMLACCSIGGCVGGSRGSRWHEDSDSGATRGDGGENESDASDGAVVIPDAFSTADASIRDVDLGSFGSSDAGVDAAIEAGADLGIDAGIDLGASMDAGIGLGPDLGSVFDAGSDSATDLGASEGGFDSGSDAGGDLGADLSCGSNQLYCGHACSTCPTEYVASTMCAFVSGYDQCVAATCLPGHSQTRNGSCVIAELSEGSGSSENTDLVLGAGGTAHISSGHSGYAHYVHRTDAGWVSEDLGLSGDFPYSCIALGPDESPHVAWYEGSPDSGDLMYAHWNGATWDVENMTTPGGFAHPSKIGAWCDMAVGTDGTVHISYVDRQTSPEHLFYARRTTSWARMTVASSGRLGQGTSLALDSAGDPHICFYSVASGDLLYTSWNGSAWTTETVDATDDSGASCSLALDSMDRPHILYVRETSTLSRVRYASWTGSAWTLTPARGNVAPSLALDAFDQPHISYAVTDEGYMYAHQVGGIWEEHLLDDFLPGHSSSIAVAADGSVHVSYVQQWGGGGYAVIRE